MAGSEKDSGFVSGKEGAPLVHDERRLYPRVVTNLGAQVQFGEDIFPVEMVNLSLGGFLIEGCGRLVDLPKSPVTGAIEFGLSFEIENQKLTSQCRVVYKRRLSVDKAALGLKIIDMDESTQRVIDTYVRNNLSY
ncbi:PilZ domain-containing protein [Marinobacterium ramblicola]|uniref:PilZ domain-containing protein n=1 Tax=Marinobacterium ramblicola TaxID=2849041 RepID=UPI0024848A1D|nr:PilZ domain-containing protein [Marinobacterium ramblicola]